MLSSVLSALWMGVAVPEGPQSIALPGGDCEGTDRSSKGRQWAQGRIKVSRQGSAKLNAGTT